MLTKPLTLETAMTNGQTVPQCFAFGRIWRILFMAFVAGLLASSFTGCRTLNQFDPMRTFDEPLAGYRNNVWAKRAYNLRYGNCDRAYGDHFREGFISGYCNVCEGGEGYIPAMPPQTYWETRYQCPEGAKCVNAWFEGFPAGVAAARKDGSGAYHDVYISNMINAAVIQENAPAILPGDVPVTTPDNVQPGTELTPIQSGSPAPSGSTIDPSAGMPLPMSVQPASYDFSGPGR